MDRSMKNEVLNSKNIARDELMQLRYLVIDNYNNIITKVEKIIKQLED